MRKNITARVDVHSQDVCLIHDAREQDKKCTEMFTLV